MTLIWTFESRLKADGTVGLPIYHFLLTSYNNHVSIYHRLRVTVGYFLALLDYVSRAPEIEIRPASVRLWHRLSLNLLQRFLSNFSFYFLWATPPDVFFFHFRKKNNVWILTNIFPFR